MIAHKPRVISTRDACGPYASLITVLCVCVVLIMLVAGLWPFHAPMNEVKWLTGKNGLEFAFHSGVVSTASLHSTVDTNASESLEIWLIPDSRFSTNPILTFEGPDHRGSGFLLRQYRDLLMLHKHYIDNRGVSQSELLGVRNPLPEGSPVFVSITMGEHGTAMYLNGVVSGTLQKRGTTVKNLSGRFVLADSVQGRNTWPGKVLGLAMYDTQLTPSQVTEHYETWTTNGQPTIREGEIPIGLYLFNERTGNVVHNRVDARSNLVIPKSYFALHPPFLASVRQDYQPTLGYWQDVGVNIIGFIPFGFIFSVLWSEVHLIKYPALTTISVGLLISLLIEVLQAFLPTRSSGSTDLITNTFGAALGVMIHRTALVHNLLANFQQEFCRIPVTHEQQNPNHENSSPDLTMSEQEPSISA
jgi:VanZ family protein